MTAVEFPRCSRHIFLLSSTLLQATRNFSAHPQRRLGLVALINTMQDKNFCGVKQPELIRCIIPILNSCTLQFPQALSCAAHCLEGQVIEKNERVDRRGH